MSVKTAGVGHFTIPTAPAAGTSCTSGAANTFTTNYVQLIASTAAALYITGIYVEEAAVTAGTYIIVQLATGAAASETIVGQYLIAPSTGSTVTHSYRPIFPPIPVAISTRIACKTADSVGSQAKLITLECIAQSNVVDDGIAVGTVTTVTNQLTAAAIATGVWQDATAGDFTAANSIGKSVMNGVALGTGLTINAYTGNTVQTGDSFAIVKSGGAGDNAAIKAKTDNLPAAPASTTNITAGTITTVTNLTNAPTAGDLTATMKTSVTTAATAATPTAAAVTGAVGSVTAAVTVGTISANVITAASIAADAGAELADAVWDEVLAGHLGVGSAGLALTSAGALGTPLDAAGVRAAVGLASANLDTQLGAIKTDTAAVKVQTDKLVFTVANKLDVNVLVVNGITVTGDGHVGTEWGPA